MEISWKRTLVMDHNHSYNVEWRVLSRAFLCRNLPALKELDSADCSNIYHPSTDAKTSNDGMYATVQDARITTMSPSFPPPDVPQVETTLEMQAMPDYAVVEKASKQKIDDSTTTQTSADSSSSETPPIPTIPQDYEKPVVRSGSPSHPTDSTSATQST